MTDKRTEVRTGQAAPRAAEARLSFSEPQMRRVMERVGGMIVDHFTGLKDRPVTTPSTLPSLQAGLAEPLPQEPVPIDTLLDQVQSFVLDQMTHQDHPRNFAFVPGPSNFVGAMADALASACNIFCGAWIGPSGSAQIEITVIEWLRQLFEFPETAGGLFVSGGSMANMTCLAVARHEMLANNPFNATVYFSDQTHSSVAKGLKILGFQQYQLRKIGSDSRGRLKMEALVQKIASDRQQGLVPFCIVANAGTTNAGAVDPLHEIADLAAAEGLWMHVDGAYGGSAALSASGRIALDGMNRADSLSIDPHKWMFQPYEIGCALVRNRAHLKDTFRVSAEYLKIMEESAEQPNFSDYGVQLTRGFRALKLWMSLKAFGIPAFREAIEHGIGLAVETEARLRRNPAWEIVTPACLGVVTFRYRVENMSEADLDSLNARISSELIMGGYAMLSPTVMAGRLVLRMCTINPRTTVDDIHGTVKAMEGIAGALA
nr:aminotransferase class V-fold PLP-dependent enzyme [uncultured Gellertiella sp.]